MFVLSSHCLPMYFDAQEVSQKSIYLCLRRSVCDALLSRMFGHSLVNIVIYRWPMVIGRSKHTMHIVIFNQVQSLRCQKQTASPRIFCPFECLGFVLRNLVSLSLKPIIVFSPLWRRPGPICVIAENFLTDELFERKFNGPQSYQSVWLWTYFTDFQELCWNEVASRPSLRANPIF